MMHESSPDLWAFPDCTSLADIAADLGVTVREVRLSFTEPIRSDGNSRGRPTAERDAEIVGRYRSLETVKEIATAIRVSTTTVLKVLERAALSAGRGASAGRGRASRPARCGVSTPRWW
jgi:hypothetical protein